LGKITKNRISCLTYTSLLFLHQGRKCLSAIFIVMENKSITKGTMRKAHIIGSMIHSKFPIDVAEFVLEVSPEVFTTWNADTLHELEFNFFQIPQKKIFEKIEFFIETTEIESDGDNQLLTIRFILVGDLNINEMEEIGIAFRNKTLSEFGGNLYLKLKKQVDLMDFIVTISPLQLINPYETSLFPDWLMERVLNESLIALPKSFFIKGQHKQLTTSFL
jgi:hypothetical protein